MPTLVANIGTSDIAVKVGDRYIPISFDRSEPNLIEPSADTPDGAAWHGRWASLAKLFENELHLSHKPKFREICQALLLAYQQEPDAWHSRISIGRIQGVIESALAAEAQVQSDAVSMTAYLVVSDQPRTEQNGYPTDTVYAFEIIREWLVRQEPALVLGDRPKLHLKKTTISTSAINEDLLHEHYYHLFQTFDAEETVYLSVKGGTYQMQQALKVQALASNTKAQIFLSPKPEIDKILAGQPSECQRVAYWRYQQNQKYQTVLLLLERWDFDGASVLLQDWQRTLQALVTDDKAALERHQKRVAQTVIGLQKAIAYMNLDAEAAHSLDTGDRTIEASLDRFTKPENLYAQCKIYAELKQIGHFLSRLGSFHEITQHCLIENLGGLKYASKGQYGTEISVVALAEKAPKLYQLMKSKKSFKRKKSEKEPQCWKLGNRYQRYDYASALMQYSQTAQVHPPILNYWRKLDFWYDIRNKLVHSNEGVNESRLEEIYNQRKAKFQMACAYEKILPTMQTILLEIKHSDLTSNAQIESSSDSQRNVVYGPYGQLREWAIALLKTPAN